MSSAAQRQASPKSPAPKGPQAKQPTGSQGHAVGASGQQVAASRPVAQQPPPGARGMGPPPQISDPVPEAATGLSPATPGGQSSASNTFGPFSIEGLRNEFDSERFEGHRGHDEHKAHATRKEKRLQMLEDKMLDMQRLDKLEKPGYCRSLPGHNEVSNVVGTLAFQYLYFGLVAVYSIVMGLELEYDDPKNDNMWFYANGAFAFAFVIEALCKIYVFGHNYFKVGWFVLEFLTIAASCVAMMGAKMGFEKDWKTTFTVLKLCRIILLGKLFGLRQEFQVIVVGFTRSLRDLWAVFFVVAVICYACTLFCFGVIGKHDYTQTIWAKDHEHYFGSIPKTMMTLFSMIIVDEWAGYARPVYFVQRPVIFFFFFFSIILTLGLLNVVTGMVVDSVIASKKDHAEIAAAAKQSGQREQLAQVVDILFTGGDSDEITEDEFVEIDRIELSDMVNSVDFPRTFTLKDLFTMMDSKGHKSMAKQHFVDGVMSLIHGSPFQQHCQALLSLSKVWRDVVSLRKEMRTMHHHMQKEPGTSSQPWETASKDDGFGDFTIESLIHEFSRERDMLGLQPVHRQKIPIKDPFFKNVDEMEKITPGYARNFPAAKEMNSVVNSRPFSYFFFLVVVVYSIMMGAELEYINESNARRWLFINGFFTMLFAIEVLFKLYVYGHAYFRVTWFLLEFLTSVSSIGTLGMNYRGWEDDYRKTFTLLKLSRILLLGKLFSLREEFQTIVYGFTRSLVSLWGIVFVLLVINYGCTLFCFSIIGKHDYSEYNYDHELFWGNIPKTMITMFSMMITDAWGMYARTVYEEQPPVLLFFYIYTVLLTWGLLNVVTGLIVDTVNQVRNEKFKEITDGRMLQQKDKLAEVVDLVFTGEGSEITEQDFISHANQDSLLDMLEAIDFPASFTLRDFFIVMDTMGHQSISRQSFVDGMHSLMTGNDFHRDCQIALCIHKIRRGIVDLRKELRTIHTRVARAVPRGDPGTFAVSAVRPVGQAIVSASQELVLPTPQASTNAWDQLRATLQCAAAQHCKEELQKRWEELEYIYRSMDPSERRKHCVMPSLTGSSQGSQFTVVQEQYFVWNKLCSAVSRESLFDLKSAIDHAKTIGIGDTSRAILLTFCDALTRHQSSVDWSIDSIMDLIARGNWNSVLDKVVEIAILYGADKNLLVNALTRLCADSQQQPMSPRTVELTSVQLQIELRTNGEAIKPLPVGEFNGSLLSFLHEKASEHAQSVLNTAWEKLDSAYASPETVGGAKGATSNLGPGYSPFNAAEEEFFIRNQIVNAIHSQSVVDVRRSLTYAVAFGVEPSSIEIEIAYRDALAKYQQGDGFSPALVRDALERADWWTALDLIMSWALSRGADRNLMLQMISKVCCSSADRQVATHQTAQWEAPVSAI